MATPPGWRGTARTRRANGKITAQLTHYVSVSAWLSTSADKKDKRTRQERFGELVKLPEVELDYIIEWLHEAGPYQNYGYGQSPIEWSELLAWAEASGNELSHWELKTIRLLSRLFCNRISDYSEKNVDAPKWISSD